MALRQIDKKRVIDDSRKDRRCVITKWRADFLADLANLPEPDGTNEDSSCLCYEDGSYHALGINGWRRL